MSNLTPQQQRELSKKKIGTYFDKSCLTCAIVRAEKKTRPQLKCKKHE